MPMSLLLGASETDVVSSCRDVRGVCGQGASYYVNPIVGLFDAGSGSRASICRAYLTADFDRTMSTGCLTVGDRSQEM